MSVKLVMLLDTRQDITLSSTAVVDIRDILLLAHVSSLNGE